MSIQTTTLDKIAIVDLGFTIWSGAKALEPSDFVNIDASDLPSSRVASYGRKNLIDRDALQPFKQIRTKAERACARVGTRLLGGYAVPQDSIDQIGTELEDCCAEFDLALETFLTGYDDMIEDWINSNPDMAGPLRRAVLPRAVVKSRFRASFSIFEVNASPRDRTNSMASVGNDLLDSVLAQVVTAFKSHVESKRGNPNASYRVEVRQTVTDMAAKLKRFSFIEPTGGMNLLADRLMAAAQGKGKIAGQEFLTLYGLLSSLRSVAEVKAQFEQYAQSAPAPAPATVTTAEGPAAASIPKDGAALGANSAHSGFEPSQFSVDQLDVHSSEPAEAHEAQEASRTSNFHSLEFGDVEEETNGGSEEPEMQPQSDPGQSAWVADFSW